MMKKMYVDEIKFDAEKGLFPPSPDRYDLRSSFSGVSPFTPTIGVRRKVLEQNIEKTKLPGPGTYCPERSHSSQFVKY